MNLGKIFLLFCSFSAYSQIYEGSVISSKDKSYIAFVNIGVVGKNQGTVSTENGKYTLVLNPKFDNDTLRFSCIGFKPFSILVKDFKKRSTEVILEELPTTLKEVAIKSNHFKPKTIGYQTRKKNMTIGDSIRLGREYGIMLKIKKTAFLKKMNLSVADCKHDTVFYRVNLYKEVEKMKFETILQKPLYFKVLKKDIKDLLSITFEKEIQVEGNTLITIEYVKELGKGWITFSLAFPGKSYFRSTSQGAWKTIPVAFGMNVEADVEQ